MLISKAANSTNNTPKEIFKLPLIASPMSVSSALIFSRLDITAFHLGQLEYQPLKAQNPHPLPWAQGLFAVTLPIFPHKMHPATPGKTLYHPGIYTYHPLGAGHSGQFAGLEHKAD